MTNDVLDHIKVHNIARGENTRLRIWTGPKKNASLNDEMSKLEQSQKRTKIKHV